MKVTKTQALMYILTTLLDKKELYKVDITNLFEISDTVFRRYMQEVRAYFYNFNVPYELKYSKSNAKYYLIYQYLS
jgi:hypothetical protein